MIVKNAPKPTPQSPAQITISGVTDGDTFNHQTLTQVFSQVASAPVGVEYTVDVAPVTPPAAN